VLVAHFGSLGDVPGALNLAPRGAAGVTSAHPTKGICMLAKQAIPAILVIAIVVLAVIVAPASAAGV